MSRKLKMHQEEIWCQINKWGETYIYEEDINPDLHLTHYIRMDIHQQKLKELDDLYKESLKGLDLGKK